MTFEFQFIAEDMHDLEGNIRLDYEMSDPGGWRRSFELYPMTSFNDEKVTVRGAIDFNEVHAIIADLEERTGFDRPYYTFSIKPMVVTKAKINGEESYTEPAQVDETDENTQYGGGNNPVRKLKRVPSREHGYEEQENSYEK